MIRPELQSNVGSLNSLCSSTYIKREENIQEERFETGHKKDLGGQPKGVRKVNCLVLAELQLK